MANLDIPKVSSSVSADRPVRWTDFPVGPIVSSMVSAQLSSERGDRSPEPKKAVAFADSPLRRIGSWLASFLSSRVIF